MKEFFDSAHFIDITREFNPSMPVWPSSDKFNCRVLRGHQEHAVQVSELQMNLHTGTHMDSPKHFVADGADIASVDIAKCKGEVWIQDVLHLEEINAAYLNSLDFPPSMKKLLLKTKNSQGFKNGMPFDPHYAALTKDGAKWVSERGLELIGIDGPSIELYHGRDYETHRTLLNHQVLIIEGLDLSLVETGRYYLWALPLKIANAEASPVRALVACLTVAGLT